MAKVVLIICITVMIGGLFLFFSDGFLKSNNYDDLSLSELNDIAVDWNYRDLQRNLDDNNGKIIQVYGIITNTQPDIESLTFCEQSKGDAAAIARALKHGGDVNYGSSCDYFFIDISHNPICTKTIKSDFDITDSYIPYACSNYLKDDKISGWAEIVGLSKAVDKKFLGITIEGEYVPTVRAIHFNCGNC